MKEMTYVTPEVEVIEVEVEKGFSESNPGNVEDPESGGSI